MTQYYTHYSILSICTIKLEMFKWNSVYYELNTETSDVLIKRFKISYHIEKIGVS